MKKIIVLLIGIITLSGCSTVPTKLNDSILVQSNYFNINDEDHSSILTIVRDDGFLGSGCKSEISINGKFVVGLDPKETTTFYLKPGNYAITGMDGGNILCSSAVYAIETNLKKGEHKFFRIAIGSNFVTVIVPYFPKEK